MNITEMLGLQDERMASVVKEYWAGWVAFEPRLGVVDDPAGLDAWRRAADPAVGNDVLLGLARLAAFDGADDREAALVLAWLLLPTALRVRRRLGLNDDRVDEVLAAQLWVEVRGLPWRRPHWVAAKVAGQLREGVLLDCGASTHHQPRRLSTVTLGPVDPADDRLVEDEDPAVELAELLDWACAEDVITHEDRELLVSLIEAAKTVQAEGHAREGGVAGLSSRQLSAVVAEEWGVCARTVRRRTARCVAALSEAAGEYLSAVG